MDFEGRRGGERLDLRLEILVEQRERCRNMPLRRVFYLDGTTSSMAKSEGTMSTRLGPVDQWPLPT